MAKYGLPIVEIIAEVPTCDEACAIEMDLIAKYGRKGYEEGGLLVNLCTGGRYRVGFNHSIESRSKISDGLRGRKPSDAFVRRMIENNPAKTLEARKKISASKMGHKVSDETKAKLSANSSSKRPEVASKISKALKGRRGALHCNSKKVEQWRDGFIVATHESILLAADNTGSDFRLISAVCNGKRKRHNGYEWRFA